MLLIGDGDIEANLAKEIFSRPGWGFKIVERIPELTEQSLAKVRDYFRKRAAEEVILTDLSLERSRVEQLLDLTTEFNVIFKYFPGYFETQSSRLSVQTLAGLPVIEIKQTALEGWGRIFKRVFDIVIASSCLLVLIPFGLVVGTIIVLDSPGPMILGLKRVGVKGKEFTLYKFRSMIKDAHRMKQNAEFIKMSERAGPLFKIKNDPRVTRVGKFLRKTSIDELPQLWNVLRGDMSLVGPRPHEPEEVAAYAAAHKQLLAIKPGITGLAQISGRSHLTFEEEARIDISYLQNWSLFSDIIILIRTVGVVVLGKDAE